MTIIEIRHSGTVGNHTRGRELSRYSAQKKRRSATAQVRACFRSGEIRIIDSSGRIGRIIPFNDTERKM